jgi:hypothetical protein
MRSWRRQWPGHGRFGGRVQGHCPYGPIRGDVPLGGDEEAGGGAKRGGLRRQKEGEGGGVQPQV